MGGHQGVQEFKGKSENHSVPLSAYPVLNFTTLLYEHKFEEASVVTDYYELG